MLTVVVAVVAYFLVWNEPSTATFLSDREKAAIIDLLADSRASTGTNQLGEKSAFDWKQVKAAFLDWQVSYIPPEFHDRFLQVAFRHGSTQLVTGDW